MRPKQRKATKDGDLFRARLDQIIDMKHELVQLAGALDQCRSQRGRPQPSPCSRLAESFAAPHPDRASTGIRQSVGAQISFLTDDYSAKCWTMCGVVGFPAPG